MAFVGNRRKTSLTSIVTIIAWLRIINTDISNNTLEKQKVSNNIWKCIYNIYEACAKEIFQCNKLRFEMNFTMKCVCLKKKLHFLDFFLFGNKIEAKV